MPPIVEAQNYIGLTILNNKTLNDIRIILNDTKNYFNYDFKNINNYDFNFIKEKLLYLLESNNELKNFLYKKNLDNRNITNLSRIKEEISILKHKNSKIFNAKWHLLIAIENY